MPPPLDTYDEGGRTDDPTAGGRRPYVCIFFECCNVYARVYRQPDDRHYRGRCPKCLATVTLRVGPDGVPARFFRAK